MDLRNFLSIHNTNGTIEDVVAGFGCSEYCEGIAESNGFVMQALTKMLVTTKIYNQQQSGCLSSQRSKDGTVVKKPSGNAKKQSFSNDSGVMLNNFIGLLGLEFSKNLMILFGMKYITRQIVKEIEVATTYAAIKTSIEKIVEIFKIGVADDCPILDLNMDILEEYEEENQHTQFIDETTFGRDTCFDIILFNLTKYIANKNVVSFNTDRKAILTYIDMLINNVEMKTYVIDSIDELCMNFPDIMIAYEGSFLKAFEVLYKETFADIPPEEQDDCEDPVVTYLKTVLYANSNCEIDYEKHIYGFSTYFKSVFEKTRRCMLEDEEFDPEDILTIVVTENMYTLLGKITFNMFIVAARKIALTQQINAYGSKSTRVQFLQFFAGIVESVPRFFELTESQNMFLYYVLMHKKNLDASKKTYFEELSTQG